MLVEHITLGSNIAIRETNEIDAETIELFKPFQLKSGSKKLTFSNVQVKLTVTDKGAMFDFTAKGQTAFANICCFEEENAKELIIHVEQLRKLAQIEQAIMPKLTYWMYTIPIDPLALTVEEMALVKEAGFYIYHAIYLARV